jgi:cytochrome c
VKRMWKQEQRLLGLGCAAAFATILMAAEPSGADRGREIYEKRCAGCHALDRAKVGPPLRSVFGRRAAAEAGFPYSDGLKKARVVWDAPTLDRWMTDPDSVVPDNDMSFRLDQAAERAAIIDYLKQLASKPGGAR